MPLPTTALMRVVNRIKALIAEGSFKDGDRLPTTHALAAALRTHYNLVCKAVRFLENDGLVSVRKNKGIFVGTASNQPDPFIPLKKPAPHKFLRLRTQIEQDILRGTFAHTELLSIRELSQRYAVSAQTIRKTLSALTKDRVITPVKKRYQVTSARLDHPSAVIKFISSGSSSLSMFNDRIHEALVTIELECHARNIFVEKMPLAADSATRSKSSLCTPSDFGYIIWRNGIPDNRIVDILLTLAKSTRPVAIIDELGDYTLPLRLRSFPQFKIFTLAGFAAGKQVGRYLLENGHQNVAYLSDQHDQSWSTERLRGIKEVFVNAGFPDALTSYPLPAYVQQAEDRQSFGSIPQTVQRRLVKEYPEINWYVWPQLAEIFDDIKNNNNTFAAIKERVALKSSQSTTAWVGSNDFIALLTLQALKNHSDTSRNHSIAVVGFDDIRLAAQYNITSYNFAVGGIVRTALGFMTNPESRFWHHKTRIECEGILMERYTK